MKLHLIRKANQNFNKMIKTFYFCKTLYISIKEQFANV